MLALTKRTEYGLMALTHLARCHGRVLSAREISDHCHVPLPLLMNILKKLAQHHIIRSMRGARGGYRLALPPERITLARLVRVLEGPVKFVQCVGDSRNCDLTGCCSIRSPMLKIHAEFEVFLSSVTIASLDSASPISLTVQRAENP